MTDAAEVTALRVACARLEGLRSSLEHRTKELEAALAQKSAAAVAVATHDAEAQTEPDAHTPAELERELERLRAHMMEQEESHAQAVLESAKVEESLRAQVAAKAELEACVPALAARCEEWQAYGRQKDAEC
jgi:hypothetical protein